MGCYNERAGKLATEALLQIQNSTCLMFAALSRQWMVANQTSLAILSSPSQNCTCFLGIACSHCPAGQQPGSIYTLIIIAWWLIISLTITGDFE